MEKKEGNKKMEEESISQEPEPEEFDYHDIRVINVLIFVGTNELEDTGRLTRWKKRYWKP